MTGDERAKFNKLYNRFVHNCGIFIMPDKYYNDATYENAYKELNTRFNRFREIEEYLYNPYNLGYYDMVCGSDDDFCNYMRKIKFTHSFLVENKSIFPEEGLDPKEVKEAKLNNIKRMLPLTEEEFDNIQEGTYAWYLSDLDSKYKFTKLEKLYLMEYVLLKCELKRGK